MTSEQVDLPAAVEVTAIVTGVSTRPCPCPSQVPCRSRNPGPPCQGDRPGHQTRHARDGKPPGPELTLAPRFTATAAKLFPVPGSPDTCTRSPLATEAIVVVPLPSRKTVLESVVTVSAVPSNVVIEMVVPDTPVTRPETEGRRISTVEASIWS